MRSFKIKKTSYGLPFIEEHNCPDCGHNKELHQQEKDSRNRNGVRKPCMAKGCKCTWTFS